MTEINWSHKPGELDEEKNSSGNKTSQESLILKAYKWFIQQGIDTQGVAFINKFAHLDDNDLSYKEEFQKYIDSKEEFISLGDDFKNKMSLWKIKNLIWPELWKYKAERAIFKKYILSSFDISNDEYENKFWKIISNIWISKLRDLRWNTIETRAYFEWLGMSFPLNRDIKQFLDELDITQRVEKIKPNSRKDRVEIELASAKESLDVNSANFATNFLYLLQYLYEEEGLLSFDEKLQLFKKFVPSISVIQAKKSWLISEVEIEQYINDVILFWVTSDKDLLYQGIYQDISSLEIETSRLNISNNNDISKLVSYWNFKDFALNLQKNYHEINSDGPVKFESLISEISTKYPSKVSWLSNFSQWNILEIEVSDDGKNYHSEYYEIFSISSNSVPQNRVSLVNRGWNGIYTPNEEKKLEHKFYSDFLDLVWFDNVKNVNFYSKATFEQKAVSGEIKEDLWNFQYLWSKDKEARMIRQRRELEQAFIYDGIMEEWDDFEVIFDSLTSEQRQDYKIQIESYEWSIDINSYNILQELNTIDTEWREYGFEVGTSFTTKNDEDQYTITSIDENDLYWEIGITNIWWDTQLISFEVFLETFKLKQCKRTAKINSANELVSYVQNEQNIWRDINFTSNTLTSQDSKGNTYHNDYLVASEKGNKFWKDYDLLKIWDFSWTHVTVYLWKQWKANKDKDDDKTNPEYQTERESIDVPVGVLATWIKMSWLEPKNIQQENAKEEVLPNGPKMKKWAWSYYINNFASITTIISAWKRYVEMWSEYLKQWNDAQVAKLVSKIPWISEEQKAGMRMLLESAEKKSMEEYIEKLKILDSKEATALIEKWITDVNTSEAQKEAWLFYMCEKYWVLYEKGPLIKHKWTFLWYTTLWWRIWDELYRKEEAKAKKLGIQFTEEDLVYVLLNKQWKESNAGWLKPKRRWKLYKEYEAIMWKWRWDEIEKWEKDASKKRNYIQREEFAIEELADWGWPNSIWAMKAAVWKWADGDVARLNCIPFVMMVSWAANSFFQESADAFKNGIIPTQFFVWKQTTIDLYVDCVEQLIDDIETNLGWEYIGMKNAYIKARSSSNEHDRVMAVYKTFFQKNEKWWDTLSRSLLMLNTRRKDKEAVFETWIEDNQDNSTYRSYMETFRGWLSATKDERFKEEWILKDGLSPEGWVGTWGISNWYRKDIPKHFLQQQSWGVWFRNQDMWGLQWWEISAQIDSLAENEYLDNSYKRLRIGNILKWLMDGLAFSYAQRDWVLDSILTNRGHVFYTKFNQWWVESTDWDKWDSNFSDGSFIRWNKIINRYLDNILWSNTLMSQSVNQPNFSINDITEITAKQAASKLTKNNSDNDY